MNAGRPPVITAALRIRQLVPTITILEFRLSHCSKHANEGLKLSSGPYILQASIRKSESPRNGPGSKSRQAQQSGGARGTEVLQGGTSG